MFILEQHRIVKWTVRVNVPVDGGRFDVREFNGHFLCLNSNELEALPNADRDAESLRRVLVGFDGVGQDGRDGPIAYSDVTRDQLINIPYVRTALIRAYAEIMSGVPAKGK